MTPLVNVTGGQIQGISSPLDPSITTYKGIPYAAPPTGSNRFKPPQPVIPWSGIKLCDKHTPFCPQMPPHGIYKDVSKGNPHSEDCLYLNVYVPGGKSEKPYPVFMWIHGGGFREGGGADPNFDGTGLAMKGCIVVVPTFRLGESALVSYDISSRELMTRDIWLLSIS
jgi:carboxylesterase type B